MATESYNVNARIELGAQKAVAGLDSIVKKLNGLRGGVSRVNIGFDGMITKAVALGAAYFSISGLVRGVKGLASGILEANASAEAMQASLATIYAAVEKVSFKDATKDAGVLFKVLEKVAITSTATAPELMQVFQGIYGPLRNAGLSIQNIVTLTNNAAVAASALGIDFAQASRDISAMARGTAGLDVKTFSLLQSMGLIKETTEEWNKLAPDKRAKKLMDVMNKIGGQAAEAYGKTWKGLSSTFVDIMGAFKRAFGAAVFERLKSTLEKVNKKLLDNREAIEAYLRVLGERVGTIFDNVINNAGTMFDNAVSNIDSIRARMVEAYDMFNSFKPYIVMGAKVAVGMQLAATALNMLIPVVTGFMAAMSGLASVIGAFGAVGGFGGILAGLGSALSYVTAWFGLFAATVQAAGITGALTALGQAVWIAVLPFAAVAAVITALVLGAIRFRDVLGKMLGPLLESIVSIGRRLWSIFKDLWAALSPLLELIGGAILITLIMALRVLAWVIDNILLPPLELLAKIVRWISEEILQPIFSALEPVIMAVVDAFEWLAEKIEWLVDIIGDAVGAIGDAIGFIGGKIKDAAQSVADGFEWAADKVFGGPKGKLVMSDEMKKNGLFGPKMTQKEMDDILAQASASMNAINAGIADAKKKASEKDLLNKERPITHNDFRGAKISVKQEFREADPDNVWVQFREGLEREATARTRSGFADPLAR